MTQPDELQRLLTIYASDNQQGFRERNKQILLSDPDWRAWLEKIELPRQDWQIWHEERIKKIDWGAEAGAGIVRVWKPPANKAG